MIRTLTDMIKGLLIIAAVLITIASSPFVIAKIYDDLQSYDPPANRWQLMREAWDQAQARKAARRAQRGGWQ